MIDFGIHFQVVVVLRCLRLVIVRKILPYLLSAYHEKLRKNGVKSQTFTVKGVTHGFFHLPGNCGSYQCCCFYVFYVVIFQVYSDKIQLSR